MRLFGSATTLALLALPALLPALVQAVQITDTLLDSTSVPANGILLVSWPSFTGSNAQVQSGGTTRIQITSGALNIFLAPTVGGIAFSGGCPYYTVQFVSSTGFADAEVPGGTVNGTNVVFTLSHVPYPALSLQLVRNGQTLTEGGDFTLSGATVTFINSVVPSAGDTLQAWYRYSSAGSAPAVHFSDAEVPSGSVDGMNTAFSLANVPADPNGILLTRNGLAQKLGVDFSIAAAAITFLSAAVPATGDILLTWYRY